MASAFEKVVRSVVRELDHKDLTPVDSLWSSTSFQPYTLLSRKPLSSRFWRPRYKCVNLSIRDILEPDAPEPGTRLVLSPSHGWAGGGPAGSRSGPWALSPAGRRFPEAPSTRQDRQQLAGRASAVLSLQRWSVAAPSSSMMRWTGSCRAA